MDPVADSTRPVPAPPGRWAILTGFSLLVAATQVLWLSYAPITTRAHEAMGVSEGAVGDLAAVQPLLFVLFALPAGRWLDRRFAPALSVGALLTVAGALLRLAQPGSYPWALTGQLVIAAGQPLVLNATTKIAARYFPAAERTTAISVGSAAQFAGILVAAGTGGLLEDAGGLRLVLAVHAALAAAAALAVGLAVRRPAAYPAVDPLPGTLGWLRRDRTLWLLAGLLFVGVGSFNALATWLETILGGFGHGGAGGPIIAVMTMSGVVGAAALPRLAARSDRRRALLLATAAAMVLASVGVAVVHDVVPAGITLAAEGFLLLAGLPVALDWSELHAGPERAGTAAGFLMLAGNLGGVVFDLLVQALVGDPTRAMLALAVGALPALAVAAALPARLAAAPDAALPRPAAG